MTAPIVLVEVAVRHLAILIGPDGHDVRPTSACRMDATPNVEPECAVPGLCERFGLTFPEL